LAVRERVVLPTGVAEHQLAAAKLRMLGSDDAIDRAAHHRLTQLHRARVQRSDLIHHLAHVGIERKVQRSQQHLSLLRRRNVDLFEAEVA
jgi:hypothetical protein